ncbi:DUF4174 domain-containing protein [uncultured Paracoccus sp.]|uniref:DUF4174 domain-containing protein n=1 Tax=uncultured Paracoccus sp. TaxID=189685 RepID=UPI0025EBA05C|nr:DUF4174 domain-containing protein [uncultured Paracoccus sp.]
MKFSRLILLISVPFIAAMGDRPGKGDEPSRYVRSIVGDPEPESAAESAETPPAAEELQVIEAAEADPTAYMWTRRPAVIFADTPSDPAFTEQMRMITRDPAPLLARDVVVIIDTDPAAATVWRRSLRPEGFSLVLLDKDGQVKQRKPSPWSVREIWRAIDKFPLRRQEIGRAGVVQ